MSKRSRAWALTIFNEDEKKTFIELNSRYKIWGQEICPETKTAHLKCYIYFENARTFS